MLQQYRTIAHPHPYGQEQNANKHTSILRLYSTSLSPTLYPHHKGIASAIIDFSRLRVVKELLDASVKPNSSLKVLPKKWKTQ